jgi:hypothetical protein
MWIRPFRVGAAAKEITSLVRESGLTGDRDDTEGVSAGSRGPSLSAERMKNLEEIRKSKKTLK